MRQYLRIIKDILKEGEGHDDRTGVGTLSLCGYQTRFNLRLGFPLLTTKRLPFRWIAEELFWFLSGSTDEHVLQSKGVNIWQEWATEEQCAKFKRIPGDLGPVYGFLWRNFGAHYGGIKVTWVCGPCQVGNCDYCEEPDGGCAHRCQWPDSPRAPRRLQIVSGEGVDQIARAVEMIQTQPNSRRIIVTGWDARYCDQVALPPCHTLHQFKVHEQDGTLSCHLFARSIDSFLGLPFNIATYALYTHLMAHVCGLGVRDLIITFTDLHLYKNHVTQAHEQLTRAPRPLPALTINPALRGGGLSALLAAHYEDLKLEGYNPHPKIEAPVAV